MTSKLTLAEHVLRHELAHAALAVRVPDCLITLECRVHVPRFICHWERYADVDAGVRIQNPLLLSCGLSRLSSLDAETYLFRSVAVALAGPEYSEMLGQQETGGELDALMAYRLMGKYCLMLRTDRFPLDRCVNYMHAALDEAAPVIERHARQLIPPRARCIDVMLSDAELRSMFSVNPNQQEQIK